MTLKPPESPNIISPRSWGRRRAASDRTARRFFFGLAGFPILLALVIFAALFYRSWPILTIKPLTDLLLGRSWLPSQGLFGFFPFIAGTAWVTVVGMLLSVPVCLLTAIYLSEYARPQLREFIKPVLDLLAAIPSVVYGVWGMLTIVPLIRIIGPFIQKNLAFLPFVTSNNPTGFSILASGIVVAVMVAPFVIAVIFEVLRSVPNGYREASLAVGATRWETIWYAVLPKTIPGVIAGVVLGASRALGETMAVLMVVGNVAEVPHSLFDPAYPLPALIANNYGEMLSIPLYDSALMLAALILLTIILVFNVASTWFLRRFIVRSWL